MFSVKDKTNSSGNVVIKNTHSVRMFVWERVSVQAHARAGIILVLISNSMAPSPFTDKLRYLAASDASTAVINDAPRINAGPLLLPLLRSAASQNKSDVLKETSLYQAIIPPTRSQTNQITNPTPHIS